MNYKTIKNLNPGNEKFNGLYEMAKDGKSIRDIGNQEKTYSVEGMEKATLYAKDATVKVFGLRTLYRKSWGKALPGTEATAVRVPTTTKSGKPMTEKQKLRAKIKAEKEAARAERAKRKALKASFKTRKGKLLSQFNRSRLQEAIDFAKKKKNNFIEYRDKKISIRTIVKKDNVLLLRIETQSAARTGRFFYNIDTEKYVEYNQEVHKKGYGNENIVWPSLV